MTRDVSGAMHNTESEVISAEDHLGPYGTPIEKDPDDVLNEMLERRLWPWPIAVAYCLEPCKRRQAIYRALEALTFYPHAGELRHFTAMVAIEFVFQIHVGATNIAFDWAVMADLEATLIRGVESDDPTVHIPSYGSKTLSGTLEELSVNDWVGGEVLCSETADLIKGGFRVPELREACFRGKKEPVIWYFNIHLSSKHVKELVDRQSLRALPPKPIAPRWHKQSASQQQADLFSFFAAAMSGVDTKNATQLRAAYEQWIAKNKKHSSPIKRNAFDKWLKRYKGGVRLDNGKWVEN